MGAEGRKGQLETVEQLRRLVYLAPRMAAIMPDLCRTKTSRRRRQKERLAATALIIM